MDDWDLHQNDGGSESQGELGKVLAMTATIVVRIVVTAGVTAVVSSGDG